uniref:HEPN domain-containing protein n=1 Tax=Branchiostoma floridae TaxID=7739 RepID=C3YY70_BRAFL|eukprot:XP_002599017.1 hypothetical protein BRAFLDRAFT_79949 [Branchiostoma floridae]
MQVKSTVAPLIKKSPSHRPEDQPPYLLQTASSYMEGQQTKRPPEVPSILKDVFVEVIDSRIATESGTRINKRWLISSCIGSAESFRMAQTEQGKKNGLLPCASVAACLDADTNLPISVVGNAFCFLPLPEFTGLPIHMNAPFAIFSNRQGICKRSGSGIEQSMEVEWNKCLLRDAIPTAYLTLLQHLTLIQGNSASLVSDPFRIWPNISRVEEALYRDNLIPCFYEQAMRSPSKVLLSLDQNWISIKEATFLHPSLRDSAIGEESLQILHIWIDQQRKDGKSTQVAVDVPSWVFEGLQTCKDPGSTIEGKAFTLNTIYSEVFYPAVKQGYLANHRLILDSFVLHLLDVIFDEISKEKDISFTSLQHLPCVPSSPQGTLLRCPCELVRPDSKVGKLFDEDDQRFPFGAELKKPRRSKSLRRLGMMEKSLPWDILWERVKSFETWYPDIDQALKRMSYLYKFVVGTPALIKDVTNMTHLARTAVKHLVMVAEKPPTDQNSQSSLPTFCHAIYELLQTTSCRKIPEDKDGKRKEEYVLTDDVVRKTLIDIPFIYITKDGNFVRTRDLAFRNHGRAMTVLRTVPDELEPYRTFLRSCGVKEFFEAVDFVGALKRMAGKYGCRPLEESDLQDSLALAHNLEREHIQRLQSNRTGVEMSLRRQVFLPDREKVLRAISQLAYNDATWLPEDPSITYYVHPQIPREQAVQFFGVETVTSKLFDQTAEDFCDIGEDFGQTEEMTDRIKGILESYSTGMDIFKELLQNADDAGATERVGFNKRPDLHAEQLSFARLKCIMPRVAVAALFDETRLDVTNAVQSLQTSDKLSGQAFCYLPLPTPTTCLPVHVNGHFALDPSRRNLASSGLGGKWNELLKTQLLAPAYVSLMVESLSQVLSEGFQLRQYCSLFPVVNEEAEAVSFNALAAEVYRIIANRDENLLPVVVDTDDSSSVTFEKLSDCLFEVDGDVIDDDASETQRCAAKKTLLSIGCKVVETKYMGCIYNNFKHACIDVINFSPLSTVQWLQSQDLECVRNSCLIEDAEGLKNLLSYCLSPVRLESHNLDDCLHDVPLLLAQDKNLYRFNKEKHAYISTYHALVSAKYTYLFVHESLLEMLSKVLLQDPTGTTVKYLDIQDLASLATSHPDIVPDECLAQTTGHNSWRPDETLTRPTAEWIKLLWTFIDEKAKYGHSLHPIKYWQIIPSTRPSLFSLANAKLTFTTDTQVSPTVLDILKKLHCPFIDEGLLRVNVIDKNLASPASSKDVITVLEGVMNGRHSLEGILDKVECSALLQHLQRDADNLLKSPKLVGILRKLPVFETLDGILRCISGVRKVLALSTNANTSQLNINALLEPTGCVVLKFNENLVALYKVLEVTKVNQVILYVQHILPAFHLVSNSEQRMSYLTHIKDHLLPSLSTQSPQRYELLQKLQTTAFIANIHGKLFTADQFYNPNESLFVVAKDYVDFIRFPPQPFCDETWLGFLHDIGLHTKMDPHHFLRCASTVEEKLRGKRNEESTSLERLAREVVTYLFRHVNDLLTVLEEVSETRFIPCHHPSQHLTDIHPSADKDAVCFRGSVTSNHESLVWTTSLALPEWARPPCDNVTRLLGVLDRPPLKDVIDNCVNICSKQEGEIVRSNLCQVMKSIYQFLQTSCADVFGHCFEGERPPPRAECDHCQLINQKLCTVPCVIVEVDSGQSFAVGSRVVFEMSPENKAVFEGYLYRPYRRLSLYEPLFKCLGATESVTLAKYALILSELVDRFGSDSLDEDALPWKVACAAVLRIVELSCGDNGPKQWLEFMSETTQPILYLPSEENTLEPSQNIVILDGKNHNVEDLGQKRLTNWLKLSRVAVESIPKQFRPVFLSDITEEKFSELSTPCEDGARCPFRAFYDKTLRDVEFCRLLALSISTGGKSMDKTELIPKVRDGLANIRLHCYTTIELELCDLQNVGTSSKGKEMQACLSSVKPSSEDSTCLNMYLKHNAIFEESRICMSFNLQLAKALCNVFPEYDMDLGNVLEELMQRQPTKDTLDKIRYEVLQNTGYGYSLGSSVEELCIISFRPDINLKEGNIVAYRLPSAGKGENVFQAIFAKVVKEANLGALPMDNEEHEVAKVPTSGEKSSLLQTEGNTEQAQTNVTLDFERIFEIDANRDENLLVKVTEMYSLDKEQAVQVMERAEAMQHVTQVLEEAWDLEEDDHKRVVGRLFLYWHPKSNPSDEDYAQQVIGHIRDEIKRMLREDDEYIKEFEADIPRPRRSHSRRRSGRKRTGRNREMSDYDKMFNQLDDLTITKTTQGGGHASGGFYEERFQYSSDESQRQRTRLSPDYGEARRWFRQAQTDFASARLCEQHRYYSSAASMCHQAAEKALKAAGFAVHGSKSFDHRLDRLASNVAEYQSNFCEVGMPLLKSPPTLEYSCLDVVCRLPQEEWDRPHIATWLPKITSNTGQPYNISANLYQALLDHLIQTEQLHTWNLERVAHESLQSLRFDFQKSLHVLDNDSALLISVRCPGMPLLKSPPTLEYSCLDVVCRLPQEEWDRPHIATWLPKITSNTGQPYNISKSDHTSPYGFLRSPATQASHTTSITSNTGQPYNISKYRPHIATWLPKITSITGQPYNISKSDHTSPYGFLRSPATQASHTTSVSQYRPHIATWLPKITSITGQPYNISKSAGTDHTSPHDYLISPGQASQQHQSVRHHTSPHGYLRSPATQTSHITSVSQTTHRHMAT